MKGATIIREGELWEHSYIVQSGIVDITKDGFNDGNPFASIGRGQCNCEVKFYKNTLTKARWTRDIDNVCAATVKAASDTVVCYVMTRFDFYRVLGNMRDILDDLGKPSGNMTDILAWKSRISSSDQIRVNYDLNQLKMLNVLGYVEVQLMDLQAHSSLFLTIFVLSIRSFSQGVFWKVRLVKALDSGEFYALKAQGKHSIVENKREKYVVNELSLMKELQHPNIVTLHCSMQDNKYVYSLLRLLPGGKLMDILQSGGRFPEEWTRFYSASVLLAYSTMH
ncbi:hypothetical protein THAOC_19306, partial [Thalassiosira oceanica]